MLLPCHTAGGGLASWFSPAPHLNPPDIWPPPLPPSTSAPLTLEREAQVCQLLDAACLQASQAAGQGLPLLGTVAGLARRLEALGALYPAANMHIFAVYRCVCEHMCLCLHVCMRICTTEHVCVCARVCVCLLPWCWRWFLAKYHSAGVDRP